MGTLSPVPVPVPVPAVYLRCHPQDPRRMTAYQEATRRFALRLGMRPPTIYLDSGYADAEHRPAFEQLVRQVLAGRHRVVLIPGPWVFSADDAESAAALRLLGAAGCRVVRIPARARPSRRTMAA
ncbi:hypothetical protein ACIRBX_34880 [Kitasatospora sp. NPDC096147]|uniref:hypothetical protein n=1 Tax=Kitasatospora sp. NPDC096147 TaxID=3364093 RepID=UPI003827D1E2